MEDKSTNPNEFLIQELEKRKQLSVHNKGVYFAYNKAIRSIKQFNQPITSGEMVKDLNGIGKVMEAKIDEIVKAYKLDQQQNSSSQPTNSQLTRSLETNSTSKLPSNLKMPTVAEWLEKIGFSCYLEGFLEAGYDNIRVCEELTDEDLQHISSTIKPGHRKSVLIASKELKELRQAQRENLSIFQSSLISGDRKGDSGDRKGDSEDSDERLSSSQSFKSSGSVLTSSTQSLEASQEEKSEFPSSIPKVVRTRNGGIVPKVTDSFIKRNCSDQVYSRALDIFEKRLAQSLILDGEIMKAQVQSSVDSSNYNLTFTINLESEKVTQAICDCSQKVGWCKHIIAILIAIHQHQEGTVTSLSSSTENVHSLTSSTSTRKEVIPPKKTKSTLTSTNPKKSKTSKTTSRGYLPAPRSGPWAILVTLYEESLDSNFAGYLYKKDIVSKGKDYCDTSFEESSENGYSAWSSMKTLVEKELVVKQRNPPQYSLTDLGETLAKKLFQEKQTIFQQRLVVPYSISPIKPPNSIARSTFSTSKSDSNPNTQRTLHQDFRASTLSDNVLDLNSPPSEPQESLTTKSKQLLPSTSTIRNLSSTFTQTLDKEKVNSEKVLDKEGACPIDDKIFESKLDIILLLDNRETNQEKNRDLYRDLVKCDIKVEKRNLQLGDILWIARSTNFGVEIVIDFVIERKRISDLLNSMEDGRYLEQKFRLKKCGLSRVVYLVEGNVDSHLEETIETSLVSTQIDDNFLIQRTRSEEETVQYLVHLTHHFEKNNSNHRQKAIFSPFTYETFADSTSKSKNLTLKDLFAKQLLQIPTCTVSKVAAIVQKYPTPKSLMTAYHEISDESDRVGLLKNLEYGEKKRKLGPKLSQTIYCYYFPDSSLNKGDDDNNNLCANPSNPRKRSNQNGNNNNSKTQKKKKSKKRTSEGEEEEMEEEMWQRNLRKADDFLLSD